MMCHEKYHVDPDLRAIANVMVGLPMASSSASRERCLTASQLLLATATCEGLLAYVEENPIGMPSGEKYRLTVRLLSLRQRFAGEATGLLTSWYPDDQDTPF
jgi:hypothetical protein